jgi:hypothetical protein
VSYSFDGEPEIKSRTCPDCARSHESVTGFVLKDESAYAIYFADWYPHSVEALIDVVFGAWDDPGYSDQVTFGCRIGGVQGHPEPVASLVKGGGSRPDHPVFGVKLDRVVALENPKLTAFWDLIDWMVVNDRLLSDNVYHMPPRPESDRSP